MIKYIARPYIMNRIKEQKFDDKKEAIHYLEKFTGNDFEGYKLEEQDWELLGKLITIEE